MEEGTVTKKITYPSKQFLIRGGAAVLITSIILGVQTPWVKGIFLKKEEARIQALNQSTVGELTGKDSNNNGIFDWEERLWGLDPTKITTNGVANKTIIENHRKQLALEREGNLTENDQLARELFSVATALGQEGYISNETLSGIGGKIADSAFKKEVTFQYTAADVKTVPTTSSSLVRYRDSLESTISRYNKVVPEIDIAIEALETGDYSPLASLQQTVVLYRSFADQLKNTATPVGAAQQHLKLMNSISGISSALQKIQTIETSSVTAVQGFAEYRFYEKELTASTDAIILYLEEYDIL